MYIEELLPLEIVFLTVALLLICVGRSVYVVVSGAIIWTMLDLVVIVKFSIFAIADASMEGLLTASDPDRAGSSIGWINFVVSPAIGIAIWGFGFAIANTRLKRLRAFRDQGHLDIAPEED